MTLIKVCGVTTSHDAAAVAPLVDFLGLNFWPRSKRYVTAAHAADLARVARAAGSAKLVGVFVDAAPDEVLAIAIQVGLDAIQLHGDEPDEQVGALAHGASLPVWKAIPARPATTIEFPSAGAVLLDTPSADRGGTGITFDWSIAADLVRANPQRLIVLAGGLTPDNVGSAIAAVRPWAVDVASGVESAPGIKDLAKVEAFVAAVR